MNTSTQKNNYNISLIERELNQALCEYKLGNISNVKLILNSILQKYPDSTEALKLLAMISHTQNNFELAVIYYEKIMQQNPNDIDCYHKLSLIYQQQGNFKQAIKILKNALSLVPNSIQLSNQLAYNFAKQGQLTDAINLYSKILEVIPDNITVLWNRALALIKNGDFTKGFAEFECRQSLPNFEKSYLPDYPMWDGSDLNGKTILVYHAEDALGDIIQYIRYTDILAKKGGKVIFAAPKSLLRLLSYISSIQDLIPLEAEIPAFDLYVPLLSLPHLCQTNIDTIPGKTPYISLPKSNGSTTINLQKSSSTLHTFSQNLLKIGIVWSSGHRERNDTDIPYYRDCDLSLFVDLLSIPNISLYSLQVGKWAREIDRYKHHHRLYDLTPQIQDFADTAALITQLDLVISVDTAIAHLCGAMGLSVWTILAYDADCRWLIDRDDSPWYPSMRLFRQPKYGDWQGVFEQVKIALKDL
ncbi:MAG: tetratricopeptide repeat protein [Cyanobacteria bacterium P01_E01_bin.35]